MPLDLQRPTTAVAVVLVELDGDRRLHQFETDLSADELLAHAAEDLRGSAAAHIKVEVIVRG